MNNSASNGKNLKDYKGDVKYIMEGDKNALLLTNGGEISLPSENWASYSDITVSGMYKTSNLVAGDTLFEFSLSGLSHPITSNVQPIYLGENQYYMVFTDTSNSYSVTFPKDLTCDVLIIGGGGGGARTYGGGGGAGAMIYDKNIQFTAGEYTFKVGSGGAGSATAGVVTDVILKRGKNGNSSEIIKSSNLSFYKADGGGGGLGGNTSSANPSTQKPLPGGSGGGNGGQLFAYGGLLSSNNIVKGSNVNVINNIEGNNPSYDNSVCFGYRGGSGNIAPNLGGGGGGAGNIGIDVINKLAAKENNANGVGGIGRVCDITGENIYYAGGGGGGNGNNGGCTFFNDGGLGGGGRSGTDWLAPTNGLDGFGAGGGGDGPDIYGGANGGSGIIIIRYTINSSNVINVKANDTDICFQIDNIPIYKTPINYDWNYFMWNITNKIF